MFNTTLIVRKQFSMWDDWFKLNSIRLCDELIFFSWDFVTETECIERNHNSVINVLLLFVGCQWIHGSNSGRYSEQTHTNTGEWSCDKDSIWGRPFSMSNKQWRTLHLWYVLTIYLALLKVVKCDSYCIFVNSAICLCY